MERNVDHSNLNQAERAPEDLIDDPIATRTIREDPLLAFLVRNWRNMVITALAVAAAFYVRYAYQSTRLEAKKKAADLFAQVRESFQSLNSAKQQLATLESKPASTDDAAKKDTESKISAAKEQITQSQGRLDQALASLKETKAPYINLAKLYQGLSLLSAGDVAGAKERLIDSNWRSLEPSSEERIWGELGVLSIARVMIDDKGSEGEAKELLKALVQYGEYAHVSAAASLVRISKTEEERSSIAVLLKELGSRAPEQEAILKDLQNQTGDVPE